MDKRMEELKRQAAAGDRDAAESLHRHERRIYGVCTIFDCAQPGDWIHVEGPNFADVGVLRETYLDEIGRAIAVLDKSRRRHDETDNIGATWHLH